MTKQRPILFSTPMVQAILEGRKTQTRRFLRPSFKNEEATIETDWSKGYKITYASWELDSCFITKICKYGNVGDVLWVRETWGEYRGELYYKASTEIGEELCKWKPSIHMPKAAARILLEITNIRVERLQDISEDDAVSEGVECLTPSLDEDRVYKDYYTVGKDFVNHYSSPSNSFKSLWQSINGIESWETNPWVWVVEFKRIEKP